MGFYQAKTIKKRYMLCHNGRDFEQYNYFLRTNIMPKTLSNSFSKVLSSTYRSLVLTGTKSSSSILTLIVAKALQEFLPPMQKESSEWSLVYSLDEDGISINTFYAKASQFGLEPMLLVLETVKGTICGAYLSQPPEINNGYYGNGSWYTIS